MGWFIEKMADTTFEIIWKLNIRYLKLFSPLKITPATIETGSQKKFLPILSLEIKNRTSQPLFNVRIAGVSKKNFNIKVIKSDLGEKRVEHMTFNANVLIAYVQEKETGNYGWILNLQKIEGGSRLHIDFKLKNDDRVFFKVMGYNFKEVPITERDDGVVQILFKDSSLPKI